MGATRADFFTRAVKGTWAKRISLSRAADYPGSFYLWRLAPLAKWERKFVWGRSGGPCGDATLRGVAELRTQGAVWPREQSAHTPNGTQLEPQTSPARAGRSRRGPKQPTIPSQPLLDRIRHAFAHTDLEFLTDRALWLCSAPQHSSQSSSLLDRMRGLLRAGSKDSNGNDAGNVSCSSVDVKRR